MTEPTRDVLRLNKTRVAAAAETLRQAFWDYPVTVYSYPDETEREIRLPYFFRLIIHYCLKYGEVYATSKEMEGVAAWIPSDNYPMSGWRVLRSVPFSVFFHLGTGNNREMQAFSDYIDDMHARLAPFRHWFLQTIGVSPEHQGQGHGGRLLKSMLTRLDSENLPCYLETLDEKDISFYEHYGFKVLEKSAVPDTDLVNWAMLRNAG